MDLLTYRKQQDLTLAKLAAELGCSEASLSRYETGARRPDLEMIAKIAEKTGQRVSYADWLREPNHKNPPSPDPEAKAS